MKLSQLLARLRHAATGRDAVGATPSDDTAVTVPIEPAPTTLISNSRYELRGLIGSGGMGEVWQALDTENNDKSVAVKFALKHHELFEREIEVLDKLDGKHPGLVRVHARGELGEYRFVVMDLLEGMDLDCWLTKERQAGRTVSPADAVRIGVAICETMAVAHRLDVVHRDLKPSNIFLEHRDGISSVRVLDFGIARTLSSEPSLLTRAGAIIGSEAFMAPEALCGYGATFRSDIFAIGSILYTCLTGRACAYSARLEDFRAGFAEFQNGTQPPAITSFRSDVPETVSRAIAKSLAWNAEERFATVEEFRDALTDLPTGPIDTTKGATTKIALRTLLGHHYLKAEDGGGGAVRADAPAAHAWETFTAEGLGDGLIALRTVGGFYLHAVNGGEHDCRAELREPGEHGTFALVNLGDRKVAFRTGRGFYVCAEGGGGREACADRQEAKAWETFHVVTFE
jgi:Protein kinase domain